MGGTLSQCALCEVIKWMPRMEQSECPGPLLSASTEEISGLSRGKAQCSVCVWSVLTVSLGKIIS